MTMTKRTSAGGAIGLCVGLIAGFLCAGGCRSTPGQIGNRPINATYRTTTLTADLPEPVSVLSFMAAAEETLRARGYAIRQSDSTADSGSLVAVPPKTNDYPRMVVRAQPAGAAVRVSLSYQPFGDQELCRTSLDAILKRLGL